VKYAGTLPKIKASEFAFVLGMHKGKPVIVTSLCFESNCPEHPNRILNYNYSPERCGSVGGVVKKFKLTIYNHKRVEQFCIPGPVAEKF